MTDHRRRSAGGITSLAFRYDYTGVGVRRIFLAFLSSGQIGVHERFLRLFSVGLAKLLLEQAISRRPQENCSLIDQFGDSGFDVVVSPVTCSTVLLLLCEGNFR
ncbi:MAG: hypothetical protein H8E53_05575 [Planctomycetes bacterium]|nr:hypothetical protein [Planctomycetota bacterium]